MSAGSGDVVARFQDAQNRHDIDAFVACFAPDYRSAQPAHPGREFVGSDQVRKNWTAIFDGVPDLRSDLLRRASSPDPTEPDTEVHFVEWHWHGTRHDGSRLEMRGVTLFGVRDDLIVHGTLHMNDVVQAEETIDASVATLVHAEG